MLIELQAIMRTGTRIQNIDVLKSQLRLYAVFSLGFPAGLMISIRDGAQLLFNSLKRGIALVLVIFL